MGELQRTYQLRLAGGINVPEAARDRMFAFGKLRRFADGQFIMHRGNAAVGFFGVAAGQVTIARHSADGGMRILGVAGPGDLFGERAFLTDRPRLADAVADGAVELVHFSRAAFNNLLANEPKFAILIMRSLASQLEVLVERIDAGRTLPVAERLAAALLEMVPDEGGSIACSQRQLADLTGVSRASLGTALRQLEKSGLVTGSVGRVRIVSRPKLKARLAAATRT